MDSSPRHRSTTGSPTNFRLMVSTGGHILPRPHDKSLRYIGGETRMLTVDRHTTLQDLTNRLNKTLFRSSATSPPAIKYQLPSEDLDSLISVTTDEDLENMIDECERLNSSSRLRLFIFPTNSGSGSGSVSSIGSFLENPSKSEDWFVNALNGTGSGYSDTSSVNCLLDLDDEILLPEKKDVGLKSAVNSGQDVMETTSSFGSASSTPAVDCSKIVGGGTEEQMSSLLASPAPVAVSGSPVNSATVIQEQSDPFLSYHEKYSEMASIDSILSDLTITDQSSPVSQIQSSSYNNQATDPDPNHDQNTRIQTQQQQIPHNSPYLMPMPTTQSPYNPQLQYIHHHHPSVAVPVTSYYQHHPHQPPMDHHNFMYYIPTRQPPQGYNFPLQQPQPSQADTRSLDPTKTDLPAGVYRTNSGGPQLVRIPSGYQNQPQHVGYSGIQQPIQSMYYATSLSTGQQVRTGQQP